jgi:hypothetical protein
MNLALDTKYPARYLMRLDTRFLAELAKYLFFCKHLISSRISGSQIWYPAAKYGIWLDIQQLNLVSCQMPDKKKGWIIRPDTVYLVHPYTYLRNF